MFYHWLSFSNTEEKVDSAMHSGVCEQTSRCLDINFGKTQSLVFEIFSQTELNVLMEKGFLKTFNNKNQW